MAGYDQGVEDLQGFLAGLTDQLIDGSLTTAGYRNQVAGALRAAYEQAYTAGSGLDPSDLSADDRATIDDYLNDDLGYLRNFANQINEQGIGEDGFSEDYLHNRISMYGDALQGVFWAGASSTAPAGVTWVTESDPCDACADAAGHYESVDDLPGMPGADVCDGLDRCRCHLEYDEPDTGDGGEPPPEEE